MHVSESFAESYSSSQFLNVERPWIQSSNLFSSPPKLTSRVISFHSWGLTYNLFAILLSGREKPFSGPNSCLFDAWLGRNWSPLWPTPRLCLKASFWLLLRLGTGRSGVQSLKALGAFYLAVDHSVLSMKDDFPWSGHQQGFWQHGSWESWKGKSEGGWRVPRS